MISIILYGRNDSHGYNLHKRAALSLNCMAEVLTHATDEILFVDYNTPDDFPTFPEAIADTLTRKARTMLRVFRVRASLHERLYRHRTHLKTVEPVARNVAVRRSNPNNPWILTTNTDMIFVPKGSGSLSDLIKGLTPGLYCAPRFEIPETLWEDFDRLNPAAVIADLRQAGRRFHLDEIVLGSDDILYDAPGDFQLMPRSELFAIDAFDESMVLGWHVDSNISKRLRTKLGVVLDAEPLVAGYHCDHTRQITLMHTHGARTNCIETYVNQVNSACLPNQRDTWGLACHDVEEIELTNTGSRRFRDTLDKVLVLQRGRPARVGYRSETYDQTSVRPSHIIPFLLDMFAALPRDTRLAWLGIGDELLALFQRCWVIHGFVSPIVVIDCPQRQAEFINGADGFVVNFGVPTLCGGEHEVTTLQSFWALIHSEKVHLSSGGLPRRIVTVNAVHNRFESLVLGTINCAKTPFSTRLRHGYLRTDIFEYPANWISEMRTGSAGVREGSCIRSNGQKGHIMFGPYLPLLKGVYTFVVNVDISRPKGVFFVSHLTNLTIEIVSNEEVVSAEVFTLRVGVHRLCIKDVAFVDAIAMKVQVRLHTNGNRRIAIDSVLVDRVKL